jgi:hypothetical protein
MAVTFIHDGAVGRDITGSYAAPALINTISNLNLGVEGPREAMHEETRP